MHAEGCIYAHECGCPEDAGSLRSSGAEFQLVISNPI